jgi:hypothetical protein
MRPRTAFVSLLFAGTLVAPAAGANPPAFDHDGFQFRAAIGSGFATASQSAADGSFSATISGVTPVDVEVYVGGGLGNGWRVGWMFMEAVAASPWVSFHGQAAAGASPGSSLDLFGMGPYLDWYPDPRGGFRATLLGLLVVGGATNGQVDVDGTAGFGGGAAVGYDWWVHRRWSVGVLARISYAKFGGQTEFDDLTSVGEHVVWGGLLGTVAYH